MKAVFNEATGLWTLERADHAPTFRGLTLRLDESEARELWASLNDHFANEPIPLIPPKSVRHVPVTFLPVIQTPPVAQPTYPQPTYQPPWSDDSPYRVTCDATHIPPGIEIVTSK